MNYEIIDNALPNQHSENIKESLTSSEFPWFYQSNVSRDSDKKDIMQYYFTHTFYNRHNWNSSWGENILEPILSILEPKSLIRIKGNFYPRSETEVENNSHIDYPFSHKGAIYYVNSNDGFTILNDGTKVQSIENRILLFDPSLYHNSTHCTNDHGRININFNFF
jgi:hypothetical protein